MEPVNLCSATHQRYSPALLTITTYQRCLPALPTQHNLQSI
ncbi:hypothetical protein [Nitrincola sp. MINF-07-Sa-05]